MLPPLERAREYRERAAEAEERAKQAYGVIREDFEKLAREWLAMAEALENSRFQGKG